MATRAPGKPISGFAVNMMNSLAQALDFTYELSEAKDGIYGAVTINESTGEANATGLIGQVLNCVSNKIKVSRVGFFRFRTWIWPWEHCLFPPNEKQ